MVRRRERYTASRSILDKDRLANPASIVRYIEERVERSGLGSRQSIMNLGDLLLA